MSERLKQLAEQAFMVCLKGADEKHLEQLERFAELVRQDEREQAEQWNTSNIAHRAGGLSVEQAHTDHPLRHWDRTCPACVAEVKKEGDWVSLTDKEIQTIIDSGHGAFMVIKIAESKLRERNT
jgi:hypothetical protein